MRKILFISSHPPSSKVPQAGHKIALQKLKKLSQFGDVFLISQVNEYEKKYIDKSDYDFCKNVYLEHISKINRIINILKHPLLPFKIGSRASNNLKRIISKSCLDNNYEQVHFEFTASIYFVKYLPVNVYKSITEHDITFQLYNRKYLQANIIFKIFYLFEYLRMKYFEITRIKLFNIVYVLSKKDKELLTPYYPEHTIEIEAPYINMEYSNVNRSNIKEGTILFWGAMNREENVNAVLWFIDNVFNKLKLLKSDIHLYIVGANPPKNILELISPNITVTGFVESPIEYFQMCQIAVAPLRIGAGIKIKVLECLSTGMPVIATSVGAEGIVNQNIIIANTADEFINSILKVIEDKNSFMKLN